MSSLRVVINRSGENTIAILTCRQTKKIHDEHTLQLAIMSAVTAWMLHTRDGKAAFLQTAKDFNVGDLAANMSLSLVQYLREQGVYELQVEAGEIGAGNWDFDDHLFDSGVVEEASDFGRLQP